MAFIPKDLSLPAIQVYEKLIGVAQRREKSGQKPRPIVVITDVGKDYDDLAALTVLSELHRLMLIELRAVVANLMPADKRACFARVVLDSLGLGDVIVPVARGTPGSPDEHEELAYEFSGGGFVETPDQYASSQRDGQDLLLDIYQAAQSKGEKLYLLCLSSLQDINEFASKHSELVAENTAEVHIQGGNYISKEGNLEPDCNAANNRFNLDAAKEFHSFIQTNAIPSYTYTKIAAFAAPLVSNVFVELEATGHPIGAYLRRVQVEQDLAFYQRACESDPKKRFAPFMDQEWFLANKTNWHLRVHREVDSLPTGKEIIPFLTKLVLYDVHAALGVAGEDVVTKLNVFQGKDRCIEVNKAGSKVEVHHRISCDDMSSTVIPNEIQYGVVVALSALMKGSLLAVQQGFSLETSEVGGERKEKGSGGKHNQCHSCGQIDHFIVECCNKKVSAQDYLISKTNGMLEGRFVVKASSLKPRPSLLFLDTQIKRREISCLIDTRAMHSFMSQKLARKLGLPTNETVEFMESFTLHEMDEVDLILDNTFFEMHLVDVRRKPKWLVVCCDGKEIVLQLSRNPMVLGGKLNLVSLKQLVDVTFLKVVRRESEVEEEEGAERDVALHICICKTLTKYKDVLTNELPKELPPRIEVIIRSKWCQVLNHLPRLRIG